jgi:glycerol-3-phosphate dehydrogenase
VLYDGITGRDADAAPAQLPRAAGDAGAVARAAPRRALLGDLSRRLDQHPERLGLELIGDACAGNPDAVAVNYARLVHEDGGLILADAEGGGCIPVRARIVVNATGAWIDESAASLGARLNEPSCRGTKGSHLILDNPALMEALGGHMIYFENADGRSASSFPISAGCWPDRPTSASTRRGDVRCEHGRARLHPRRVAGLSRDPRVGRSRSSTATPASGRCRVSDADFTGRISRGHFVRRLHGDMPQICMVGGKWTTFRAFAEEVDLVLADLGQPRRASTRDLAIGGGAGFPRGGRRRRHEPPVHL